MRVLEICAVDNTVKGILLPLIDRLLSGGFHVTSCCSYGYASDDLRARGYRIKNILIPRSLNPFALFRAVIELTRYIKGERFDIVHVHTPVAALAGRVAAKLAGIPLVIYTTHGFHFHDRMGRAAYHFFLLAEKIAGRLLTDHIFTVSREDYETALRHKITGREKISFISNGVDVESRFNPSNVCEKQTREKRLEFGIEENDKVILFVGRLVKEKGVLDLLDAFNLIKQDNVKLLLVGVCPGSERDKETFTKISGTVKKSPRIIMAGRREDIPGLLHLSHVFVLPSYREGLPLSIMEAMAMGKPVVASDIRGCREEVVDGETGYLIEPGNAGDIKDKLLNILNDPQLARKMGCGARKRAVESFNIEKALDRQVRIIEKIAGNLCSGKG